MRRGWSPSRITAFLLLSLIGQIALTRLSHAAGGDVVPGSRYVSGRGAAMGDAFISFADDGPGALFYNPAAIGRLKDLYLEPLNLQFQTNGDLTTGLGSAYDFPSLASYKDNLERHPNTNPGGSAAVASSFAFRGFAAGVLLQSRLRATSDGNGNITYRSVYQLIPAVGVGVRLASGVLRLGYVLQHVSQASGTVTTASTTEPLGWNQRISEGAGISHNLGMAVTLPYVYQPAINIVARNVLGVSYSGKSLGGFAENAEGTIPDEEMSLDASFSFLTKVGNGHELRVAYDYRDATNVSGVSALGRSALGAEFSMRNGFFLRGGVGSGYPAAGVGVRTRRSEVNLGWFSEEVGSSFRDQRDMRYIFQYRVRAF